MQRQDGAGSAEELPDPRGAVTPNELVADAHPTGEIPVVPAVSDTPTLADEDLADELVALADHERVLRERGWLDAAAPPIDGAVALAEFPRLLKRLRAIARILADLSVAGIVVPRIEADTVAALDSPALLRRGFAGVAVGTPADAIGRSDPAGDPVAGPGMTSGAFADVMWALLTGRPTPRDRQAIRLDAFDEVPIVVPGVPQLLDLLWSSAEHRPDPHEIEPLLRAIEAAALPPLRVGLATSVGLNRGRSTNEDAVGCVIEVTNFESRMVEIVRVAVADGMGGMAAGELASRAAVAAFLRTPLPSSPPLADDRVVDLAVAANLAAWEALGHENGGCTLTAAVIVNRVVSIAHVGDCRGYLFRGGDAIPLTRDHSYVAQLVESGAISEAEAAEHPDRNRILRALGLGGELAREDVDTLETVGRPGLTLEAGDALVLMSDGVWGVVEPAALGAIVRQGCSDPQAVADALVRAALDRGAPDNATALVVIAPAE